MKSKQPKLSKVAAANIIAYTVQGILDNAANGVKFNFSNFEKVILSILQKTE